MDHAWAKDGRSVFVGGDMHWRDAGEHQALMLSNGHDLRMTPG